MGVEKNIPEGWVETTLGDLIEVKHGFAFKGEFITEVPYNEILVTPGNFKVGGGFKSAKFKYYSGDIPEDYVLKSKDIIVTMTDLSKEGDTLGYSARVPTDKKTYLHNQRIGLVLFKNEKLDKEFAYWFLRTRHYQKSMVNSSTGSTVSHTSPNRIKEYSFNLPSLPEQKAIAKVLTAFDDKIEILQAQNKTLETMAQNIFKEWFGKYQQESTSPNGWRIFSLSELVDVINGYSYKGVDLVEVSNEALVTLKSFDRNGGFQTRGFKPFKGSPKTQHEVKIGDLVVAHTDLTQDAEVLGNPAFIFDNGGFEKMYITMDLVKVISKNENIGSSFLYYLMKDRYFKGHCVGYSNGTTVLHLSKKAIPEYQLYLPENFDLIKKFTKIANDTTNKISLNKDAIKSLTKTRDTLLPKLMSGQVRVNNIKQTANA